MTPALLLPTIAIDQITHVSVSSSAGFAWCSANMGRDIVSMSTMLKLIEVRFY